MNGTPLASRLSLSSPAPLLSHSSYPEELLQVDCHHWRMLCAEISSDPFPPRVARDDYPRSPPQEEPLDQPDETLPPSMERKAHRIEASVRHSHEAPREQRGPPKTRPPCAMHPYLVGRAKRADTRPPAKRHRVPRRRLIAADKARGDGYAVGILPAVRDVQHGHRPASLFIQHMPTTSSGSPSSSRTARVTPKSGLPKSCPATTATPRLFRMRSSPSTPSYE